MAFKTGLHNRVIIYPKQYNTQGDRTQKDQLAHQEDEAEVVAFCRIIHEEKALFEPQVKIASGDRLWDVKSGEQYEVLKVRKVYGKETLHHLSCDLRKWGLDNGRDKYRNR